MPVAVVSTKGQITLPAKFRKQLGIEPHGRVEIQAVDDAIVIRPVGDFFELKGFLGEALPAATEGARMRQAAAARAEEKVS